ncbi:MAG: hypothetical protein ACYS8Z_09985 [Planctomycetota bacterium]|jgi:hypothetical protein
MSQRKPHTARHLSLPGLVFFMICLCSCVIEPEFTEALGIPFLNDRWEYAYGWEKPDRMIAEYVRPGQTVEKNWTELLTVDTYNKAFALASVEDHIANFRKILDQDCPGSTVEVIRQAPNGVIFESDIVNCEGHPGEHEQGLARIIDGAYNRFIVTYGVRGAVTMTPERRAEWLEELMTLSITLFVG